MSLVLYLTSTMQIYTVRLPASAAFQLHEDESMRWARRTKPIISLMHHLSAEIEDVVKGCDSDPYDRGVRALFLSSSSVMKHLVQRSDQVRLGWIMDGCADSTMSALKPHSIRENYFTPKNLFVSLLLCCPRSLFWISLLASACEWERRVMSLARCSLCDLYRNKKYLHCCCLVSLLKEDLCSWVRCMWTNPHIGLTADDRLDLNLKWHKPRFHLNFKQIESELLT